LFSHFSNPLRERVTTATACRCHALSWASHVRQKRNGPVESLTGELKRGGKLSGKINGAIAGQKPAFSWELQFDLVLPQRAAGAGPSC
jgi:hypothetical protein